MNIDQIRKDSPSTNDLLFFDSAGSSLMPKPVTDAVKYYFDEESYWGGYKVMLDKMEETNLFYQETSKLINCGPKNIAFATSATDAFSKAVSSISFATGDVILITDADYVSNYMYLISLIRTFGIVVKRIKSRENGDLDLEHLEILIEAKKPKLVVVTHMPTNSGLIQDAVAVGELCSKHQILYLLDACQSVGQINVNVVDIKCDFMSVTGRKFIRGPRGTGFLYVSDTILEEQYAPMSIDAWSAQWVSPLEYKINPSATRFEHFEKPYPMFYGFSAAIRYINEIGIDQIETRNALLANHLRSNLSNINGIKQLDLGTKKSNIITFIKANKSQEESKSHLNKHKVMHSMANKFSALIDFEKKGQDWAIRLSPHYFNTIAEIDQLSNIVDLM